MKSDLRTELKNLVDNLEEKQLENVYYFVLAFTSDDCIIENKKEGVG